MKDTVSDLLVWMRRFGTERLCIKQRNEKSINTDDVKNQLMNDMSEYLTEYYQGPKIKIKTKELIIKLYADSENIKPYKWIIYNLDAVLLAEQNYKDGLIEVKRDLEKYAL